MRIARSLARVARIAALVPLLVPSAGAAESPEATQLLRQAFANQYEVDLTSTIELVIRNGSGQQRRRRVEAASKIIGDRMHSIGRLVHPEHLRGMTILQIEAADRSHDAFVYLPSMQAVRRVSTAQRGDAFFGTDVTYEDLERRHARDYEILDWARTEVSGEPGFRIRTRPRAPRSYQELLFFIAEADFAILEARYFKRDATEPFRVIEVDRKSVRKLRGHTLPTRLLVRNHAQGTSTEVTYEDLTVNPKIDDRVFSIRTLEQRRKIPH